MHKYNQEYEIGSLLVTVSGWKVMLWASNHSKPVKSSYAYLKNNEDTVATWIKANRAAHLARRFG